MESANIYNLLYVWVWQLLLYAPLIIVYGVGIFFSISKYRTHPKVALLSGVAFLTLLILTIISSIVPALTTYLSYAGHADFKAIAYIAYFVGFILEIISATAFALIISAVWKDRK